MKKKFKISFNSPVVLGFVIICFAVSLLGVITGGVSTKLLFMTWHSPLSDPLTYIRLFTHVFGHAGFAHLIGNASYLLLLGPMLEEKYGSKMLIELIALTAFVTGLVNYILFWDTGLCGASGVVFAFIILASFTGFKDGEIPLTFILVAVIYIGQQVYDGITAKDDISNMAHIVGGLVGAVVGYLLNKKAGEDISVL
ncbi:MAG: rhomboid family intramembrane serine protease [Lachnospiraceae bacterium]|nr:rhomboid family intramembrane serine protease [Lachnospiraceae bacterium]